MTCGVDRAAYLALLLLLACCDGADPRTERLDESSADGSAVERADAGSFDDGSAEYVPAPEGTPCSVVSQLGCGAGEKCDVLAGRTACVPDGTLGEFRRCDPASAGLACMAGYTCLDSAYGDYRCAKFCDPDAGSGCDGAGQSCSSMRMRDHGERYFACTARHECSPVAQDCADATKRCAWTPAGAFCIPMSGRAADGEGCLNAQDCMPGSTCLGENLPRQRCFRMCAVVDDAEPCKPGEVCVPLGEVWPDEIGSCREE